VGSAFEAITSVVLALLLVVGAPAAIWWWMRRTRGGSAHRIRITDKAALGRNAWVAILEVDDKRLLVGAGEHGVALVSELDALPPPSDAEASLIDPYDTRRPRIGRDQRPGMGLYRRLQQMTLRTPGRSPLPRPFDASRR
jgi:flagellar biogenesis protein FliO